ncbi:MAG: aminotransferase class III-fold pyridoxal phosphate-dependent enzyme [Ahrensia sp.]|nr:aminotransferase class III-fold pyridoxal phosphate-dependent enzyme [Ahrensia sp.]
MVDQQQWRKRAAQVLPAAGFGNFDPSIFIKRGDGARVWDEDGKEYIDYLIGSGPMLIGHGHPEVLDTVRSQLGEGMTFFANNAAGVELAEEICAAVPCAEQVRYVTSGGEADMYAIRLARAFTGRSKLLKFEGGYHGMSAEAQMSLAPSRDVNFPQAVPDSAGIPQGVADEMIVSQFNDLELTASLMSEFGDQIAAIIVEPLQRVVPPEDGFLQGLRDLCDQHGALLIFDEIVTGFRFSYGGAQELYGVTPDLCSLGKIIGGGFPLAATVGRRDVMSHFDKAIVGAEGFLMQLGTLSGNPVAAVAGLKTMEILRRPGSYERLREIGYELQSIFSDPLREAGIPHQVVGDPTLFDIVFSEKPMRNYRHTRDADQQKNARFNAVLRENGIFKSPAKCYPCLALTDDDLAWTRQAVVKAVTAIA